MGSRSVITRLAGHVAAALLAGALLLAGCGPGDEAPPSSDGPPSSTQTNDSSTTPSEAPGSALPVELVSSDQQRATPQVGDEDIDELVAGNTAFACDLFLVLTGADSAEAPTNLVISPYSISAALATTYAGARGDTAQQMAEALRFSLPDDRLHEAFNVLDSTLATRNQESAPGVPAAVPGADVPLEWRAVSQLWGQRGHEFLPEFLDLLATQYGAGMRLVDFAGASEPSRLAINDWVAGQTKDRIEDLLPPDSIDGLTRLVLTNALYLYAPWQTPFDPEATAEGEFNLADGTTVTASFMRQTGDLAYAAGEGWQAVQLPYRGNELALVAVVPDPGRFAEIAGSLGSGALDGIIGPLEPRRVSLWLPKFDMTSEVPLRKALEALGIASAFVFGEADLSGMDGSRDLFIQSVCHEGFISVDEEGTEAAAATAVIVAAGADTTDTRPLELKVDRPFLWLIRDVPTGSVLFLGQVVDPTR